MGTKGTKDTVSDLQNVKLMMMLLGPNLDEISQLLSGKFATGVP